jgi:hypothetical protein
MNGADLLRHSLRCVLQRIAGLTGLYSRENISTVMSPANSAMQVIADHPQKYSASILLPVINQLQELTRKSVKKETTDLFSSFYRDWINRGELRCSLLSRILHFPVGRMTKKRQAIGIAESRRDEKGTRPQQ